ncbi:carbohydrate ABC transporter permease [Cohnella zeiphila]|uniref:Carbohydrate ABC transporter permease n=1 Tax=Cohnella zeiphila TaxID=2761120 RepID=A0A7X0SNP9_9BACL|nr:carbohydrate ABC transporter permease [Cohnella zeiphila]MBB6733276.1 carbohydrate ABC transporter permease [Cohnella zeiphila]
MKQKNAGRLFESLNITLLFILAVLCLAPLLHIVSLSLSSGTEITSGRVTIFPRGFNIESYQQMLQDVSMFRSLLFTVVLTVTFTVLCMLMTILAAYPLTKKGLKGRKFILYFIVLTMYFGGGVIPDYMLTKGLHLLNSMWALILPGLISPFYMIIMMSFFRSIPQGLEEAAEIDGASFNGILMRIILPLSVPVLVTLSLFYAVGRWNGFSDSLYYITDPKLYPLQLKLYQIVMNSMLVGQDAAERLSQLENPILPESLKAASIIFSIVPIVIVYPWLQKYFVTGTMLGSVKE